MLLYCGYIGCGYVASSRKNYFHIVMGKYFCDLLMQNDYRLLVGYVYVVVLCLNDACVSILWLQICSIFAWPQIQHHNIYIRLRTKDVLRKLSSLSLHKSGLINSCCIVAT